jgi:hypothetical protein
MLSAIEILNNIPAKQANLNKQIELVSIKRRIKKAAENQISSILDEISYMNRDISRNRCDMLPFSAEEKEMLANEIKNQFMEIPNKLAEELKKFFESVNAVATTTTDQKEENSTEPVEENKISAFGY